MRTEDASIKASWSCRKNDFYGCKTRCAGDLQDSDLFTLELLNAVTKCSVVLEKVVRLLQNMDHWHSYNFF